MIIKELKHLPPQQCKNEIQNLYCQDMIYYFHGAGKTATNRA